MKNILIATALLLPIPGTALAGNSYDDCIKEERALKAKEADDCSGLKYMFNPSGCFATRKVITERTAGKCKKIGMEENVDFSAQKALPAKKGSTTSTGSGSAVNNVENRTEKKGEREAVTQQEYTIEQLKEENARLKAENSRLRTENEQLKKTGR